MNAVLKRYRWLPDTSTRTGRSDRRLAWTLYERGVPLPTVEAALLLGTARRTLRGKDAAPLPAVRSLHYFVPVIEEVLEAPLVPGYAEYLEAKLLPWAKAKAETEEHGSRDPSSRADGEGEGRRTTRRSRGARA